jgi:cytochrome c551/c552
MNARVIFIAAVSAALFLMPAIASLAQEGGGPPPARDIPGITSPDAFPRGCVDCHIDRPDIGKDVRLSTILREWSEKVPPVFLAKAQAASPEGVALKGKHPAVEQALKDIPAGCLACHGENSKTLPPLSRMMHLYHLTGGGENPYLSIFQGECTHCHKLDAKTGEWFLPSGPEK